MVRMKIAADNSMLAELQYRLAKLGQGGLPSTERAMADGAEMIREAWIELAKSYPMAGKYINNIRTEQTGLFSHEIFSEAKEADWIENGTKDLDMKTTHPFGRKSRVSKEGVPYLIVPFRWKTPDTIGFKMPKNVYDIVLKFKKMETTVSADSPNAKKTLNAKGEMVGRAEYNKGYGRLKGEEYGNMSGMVRSTDSTGKDRSGGYLSFRVISAKSPANSWKREGMPARYVTKLVAREMEKPVNKLVEDAIMEDLRA